MSNEAIVQVFDFEAQAVRVEIVDGEPWFVAKDVAEVLGYSPNSDINSLMAKVPAQWLCPKPFGTSAGVREMLCLSEQGLYFFLGRSDKSKALPLQMWVAGEVLPSIRKTGKYAVTFPDPTLLGLPDFRDPLLAAEGWIVQYKRAETAETTVKQLEAKVEADAPRVAYAEMVEAAQETVLVRELAAMITAHAAVTVSQKELFWWMREKRLVQRAKNCTQLPTKLAVDRGWLVPRHSTWTDEAGQVHVARTTGVTVKGQAHFLSVFASRRALIQAQAERTAALPEAQISLALGGKKPKIDA
jgi:prophage antirepressor-like protein